jgi:hypothetical protein
MALFSCENICGNLAGRGVVGGVSGGLFGNEMFLSKHYLSGVGDASFYPEVLLDISAEAESHHRDGFLTLRVSAKSL